MSEQSVQNYRPLGTNEGIIEFGDVMSNNAKMAVMIRRIFPSKFRKSQYIGLQMSGKLDGGIINSAPSVYTILCGEKPVNDTAMFCRAENGDIILSAPNGRIRMMAEDIDIIASGNGIDTGFVNLRANSAIDGEAPTIQLQAQDALSLGSERDINMNCPGITKVSTGDYQLVESPDVSPVTSPLGSGSLTLPAQIEGLAKLIRSLG
jgi:hypothetical protein|tara:strand:+ start:2596 stop:3213 length:618 start_codon:yes stop_codon:yes gene_type:complete